MNTGESFQSLPSNPASPKAKAASGAAAGTDLKDSDGKLTSTTASKSQIEGENVNDGKDGKGKGGASPNKACDKSGVSAEAFIRMDTIEREATGSNAASPTASPKSPNRRKSKAKALDKPQSSSGISSSDELDGERDRTDSIVPRIKGLESRKSGLPPVNPNTSQGSTQPATNSRQPSAVRESSDCVRFSPRAHQDDEYWRNLTNGLLRDSKPGDPPNQPRTFFHLFNIKSLHFTQNSCFWFNVPRLICTILLF